MSSKRIQGITIEIGSDTVGLQKALSDVNKKSSALQKELKDVERLLKFNPGNVEALAQKQKLLADQVSVTTERLDMLRQSEQQVQEQFSKGKISEEQYRSFKREIEFTEGSLSKLKVQLSKVTNEESETTTQTNKLKEAFQKAGQEAKEFGNSAANGIAAAGAGTAAAVGGLVTGMQEYNQDLARLRTNAETAGRDLKIVEEAFMRITEVTGETDSAVETVSNLLASGFQDNQLASVIEQINGAAIKFSDTLKTEGIADGIQETFASGAAIGPFAELLERSGIKLEDFNKKLADAKAKGEGANFILQTLSEQGFGEIYNKYQELNPEVQKNAEANAKLQKSLADLSVALTPLVVSVTEIITKIVDWAKKNPETTKTIVTITAAVGGLVGIFVALAPVITTITTLGPILGAAIGAISLPVLAVVAAIAAAIAIGVALYKNWDVVKEKAVELFNKLGPLKGFILGLVSPIGSVVAAGVTLYKNWDTIMERAARLRDKILNLFKGIKWELPKIKLPHFSLSGKFSLNPPSVPKLDIDWYAKGALFTKPTIFNTPYGMKGFGEAGPEAALPLNDNVLGTIGKMIAETMPNVGNSKIEIPLYLDGIEIARATYPHIDSIQNTGINSSMRMAGVKG